MNTAQTPHESPLGKDQTYQVGMDHETVRTLAGDLDSNERVQFWGTFESTVETPHPAIATGEPIDDIAAVLAGSKPAVIIEPGELEDPLVEKLLFQDERERYKSLTTAGARDYYGGQKYFLGQAENVKALVELYRDRGGDDSPRPADESFHRAVGEALGYAPEAIDNFIERTSAGGKHPMRKLRLGKILGKLLPGH
jgi:hypothetical protein